MAINQDFRAFFSLGRRWWLDRERRESGTSSEGDSSARRQGGGRGLGARSQSKCAVCGGCGGGKAASPAGLRSTQETSRRRGCLPQPPAFRFPANQPRFQHQPKTCEPSVVPALWLPRPASCLGLARRKRGAQTAGRYCPPVARRAAAFVRGKPPKRAWAPQRQRRCTWHQHSWIATHSVYNPRKYMPNKTLIM